MMTSTAREISNNDDVIDSRDVIARIEELEAEIAQLTEMRERALTEMLSQEEQDELRDLFETVEDNADELAALRELAEEASGYAADWLYGETLIRDSYFVTYAQELAEDIGAINPDAAWPATCIDWEQAARELQIDYTSVEFDGVTYWIR
jgi:antirestriction protein